MGGSSRRQRSTSATRRRADRRRACSTTTTVADEETTTTTTTSIHGLSSILIWILATSSLIVVYPPPSQTSYDAVAAAAEKLILNDITPSLKMYGQYDHQDQQQQQQPQMVPSKYDFPQFNRRMGLRWRDDDRMRQMFAQPHHQQQPYPMMNPVLTEHHPTHSFGMPSTSSHQGTSYGYNSPTPTLEDIDLIDCLWRNDIAGEKGTTQVSPADQYVSDLQMLTEKSTVETLTTEESLRYEDLSKNFYEGFYNPYSSYPKAHSEQMKATTPDQHHHTPTDGSDSDLPTDEDLEELLKEVDHEESELNRVFENKPSENPVINNVSLAEATVYTQANLTEMQELHDMCNQVNITASSVVSASDSATLFNVTDEVTREMWQESDLHPSDLFPQSDYMTVTAQNNTPEAITSNGTFEHAYGLPPISPLSLDFASSSSTGRQQQTQTSPASATVTAVATQGILEYEGQRNSFSDSTTDSSSPCSGMSSPSYDHESRFYGKLLPHRENFFDRSSTPSSRNNGAVATKINRVMSSGQRKRGRQSKDEQLASEHSLPVTAHQISEMSLSDLQNVLKMDGLSEYQKQLIRKIRRRGKNKVAARTCRQRRTDRHDKQTNMNHYI
ncbi:unnamed protein product [Caenorhabditis nigoni]